VQFSVQAGNIDGPFFLFAPDLKLMSVRSVRSWDAPIKLVRRILIGNFPLVSTSYYVFHSVLIDASLSMENRYT